MKLSERMVDRLDKVEEDSLRNGAARLLLWTVVVWALSHVGLAVLPPWFFEHIMLALSNGAIVLTCAVLVITTDLEKKT